MGIYVLFLCFILIVALITNQTINDDEKKKVYFLNTVFIAMFLLYSLRASSVGRDLPGYERMYIYTQNVAFEDFNYVYYENGYILLMKVCNILGLSFQSFLFVVDFLILSPVYYVIKKYSSNAFMSVLIYIGFMFFEFNMTGIRQAIASSIFLIGYVLLVEKEKFSLLWYVALVVLACCFHSGAFVAFFYVPLHFIKKPKTFAIIIPGIITAMFFSRGFLMSLIKQTFSKDSMNAQASLYIGANFIFTVFIAVIILISALISYKTCENANYTFNNNSVSNSQNITFINCKLYWLSVLILILFGNDNAVRSYMIICQVIIFQLPHSLNLIFEKKSYYISSIVACVFFIIFLFTNTLIPNNFDIIPYKFFWQS